MSWIFLWVILAIAVMVTMLRLRYSIGLSIMCAGLIFWLAAGADFSLWPQAFMQMVHQPSNWALLAALYLIVCLEIILRRCGLLAATVRALHKMFHSSRVTLGFMPAFLGLLPSIGGARFSAPIVKEACQGMQISPHRQAAINFWFRHVVEFCCPLMTTLLLTESLTGCTVSQMIKTLWWLTPSAMLIGWVVLLQGLKEPESSVQKDTELGQDRRGFLLAVFPVALSMVLIVGFSLSAPLALLVAVLAILLLVNLLGHKLSPIKVFGDALEPHLLLNVGCILLFIEVIKLTGTLQAVTQGLNALSLPPILLIALLSLVLGVLIGEGQGYIAAIMPIVFGMVGGDIVYVATAFVCAVAGGMLSPAHLCMSISVEYFRADYLKFWIPIFVMEMMLLALLGLWLVYRLA